MSDFVPMTRERLRNFSDGAVEGFVEQLAETALAYLDRAEQDEAAMMRALDLRDKFAAEVVVATQRVEQAEAWATAATDALSSLIDWTRRYIEAHPSAQGASYGTILHDSEATLRALLAADQAPLTPPPLPLAADRE